MQTGIVPDDFKLDKVSPIYKPGATDDRNNYHPISVLPIVSKILQKAIHDRRTLRLGIGDISSQHYFKTGFLHIGNILRHNSNLLV